MPAHMFQSDNSRVTTPAMIAQGGGRKEPKIHVTSIPKAPGGSMAGRVNAPQTMHQAGTPAIKKMMGKEVQAEETKMPARQGGTTVDTNRRQSYGGRLTRARR